jgi:choline kinase
MIKINQTVLNKIKLQAEEAEIQGFNKLAQGLIEALKEDITDNSEYSFEELSNKIYYGLWKIAFDVIGYHNLESVDVKKLDETITALSSSVLTDIENSLDKNGDIGPNEPMLPGESK